MKKSLTTIFLFAAAISILFAQDKAKPSPPATAEGTIDGVNIKIDYSAPSARGRKMLGGIEAYGKVWRTGANAATTFTVDKPVAIEGKVLAAGKYELFTIPGEAEWTIILQTHASQWGAFKYSDKNDVLRVNVKAGKPGAFVETLTFGVDKNQVTIQWENTAVAFAVKKG